MTRRLDWFDVITSWIVTAIVTCFVFPVETVQGQPPPPPPPPGVIWDAENTSVSGFWQSSEFKFIGEGKFRGQPLSHYTVQMVAWGDLDDQWWGVASVVVETDSNGDGEFINLIGNAWEANIGWYVKFHAKCGASEGSSPEYWVPVPE